jgi:hypothetical protein
MLKESLMTDLSQYDREQNLRAYLHELSAVLDKTDGAVKDTLLIKRKGLHFINVIFKDENGSEEICIEGCDYSEIAEILTYINTERRARR